METRLALETALKHLEATSHRNVFTEAHARSLVGDLFGAETRALTVGGDSSGIVPTTYSRFFYDSLISQTVLARTARHIEPPTGSLSIPRAVSLPVAEVVGEGNEYPSSDPVTEARTISIHKLGVSVTVSEEMWRDAIPSYLESLTLMMSRSLANKVEELGVAELAATTMTESVSHTGNASVETVDLSDLVAAAGKLPVHASRPAWYMSPVVYAQTARRMVSNVASGQADLAYNKVQPMLLGLPVYLSSFLPSNPAPSEAYAYLMDPEAAMVWATRGPSSAKVRQYDQTLAASSQIYLRASVRGRVAVVDPSLCVRCVLAAS